MEERWYTWKLEGDVHQRDDLKAIEVTPMNEEPESYVSYSFQMNEETLALLTRKIIKGRDGEDLWVAPNFKKGPDLWFGTKDVPKSAWFEFKDEAINQKTRSNTKSGALLPDQVNTYCSTRPWKGLQPHVVGYAVEHTWDGPEESPDLKFHAIQPMVLGDGRAAVRLYWDVRGDDVEGPAGMYKSVKWAKVLKDLHKSAASGIPALADWKKETGKDERKRLQYKKKADDYPRFGFRIWPDSSGHLALTVKLWQEDDILRRLTDKMHRNGARAFQLPLGSETARLVARRIAGDKTVRWWQDERILSWARELLRDFYEAAESLRL